ncbi:hypothetical protein N7456_008087 [Penicillium angulare]|uniref:Uncharacterized protein n=1 Tax=Penicillium angulare TaxID=116970 RepID=A0A9W9K9B8_9EURO|nr:hypothetical protein N7456_008087 [Penicillium angulare]
MANFGYGAKLSIYQPFSFIYITKLIPWDESDKNAGTVSKSQAGREVEGIQTILKWMERKY